MEGPSVMSGGKLRASEHVGLLYELNNTTETETRLRVSFSPANEWYTFNGIGVEWSLENDSTPHGNTIDGVSYRLMLHLLFFNPRYDPAEEAILSNDTNAISLVFVNYKVLESDSDANVGLNELINAIPDDDVVPTSPKPWYNFPETVNVSKVLDMDQQSEYYYYHGAAAWTNVTDPAFSHEIFNYYIAAETQTASLKQYKTFLGLGLSNMALPAPVGECARLVWDVVRPSDNGVATNTIAYHVVAALVLATNML